MYIGTQPYQGFRARHTYTATAGQTSFSGAGAENVTLTYSDEMYIDVYQNGVKLSPADYTATTGTTVVLAQGASVSDIVEVVKYDAFSVADTVSAKDGGGFGGNISTSGNLAVTGTSAFTGNVTAAGTLAVTGTSTLTGALSAKGGAIFNEDSADVDFRVESNGNANMLVVDGGNDKVGIGTLTPARQLTVENTIANAGGELGLLSSDSDTSGTFGTLHFGNNTDTSLASIRAKADGSTTAGKLEFSTEPDGGAIATRMTITSAGNLQVATTISPANLADTTNGEGLGYQSGDFLAITRDGGGVMHLNRLSSDGELVTFRHDASNEGNISISGSTVSFNAFSGSHWSRFTDNSKPTILKGTVIETIDEMCDWYQAQITVPKTDDTDEYIIKKSIALPDGKKVGDTISYTHEKVTYDNAVIVKENDNKHTKCKISDTEDSKRVYGVFAAWDNDDDCVNDMYVTAVGTHVVRINKDITVSAGDLLVSNGDGTAKKLGGDTSMTADVYSSIIGKVLTNIKQETYSDGSYTVPCALYCG